MGRPSRIDQQRRDLLPVVCRVFSQRGYRGATTAELARRCGVRENILYRLWRDKKAMFLAAIDDLFQRRAARWVELLADNPEPEPAAEAMIAHEARHQGEFGFYRVVFTALVEADDPEIRRAIARMYRRFHRRIAQLAERRRPGAALSAEHAAWALIGLATAANIARQLRLLAPRQREEMFASAARHLIER